MTLGSRDLMCVGATLLLLGVAAGNRLRLGPAPDATPHMERVRAASDAELRGVPGMIVKSGSMPRQAFDLLRPNVLDSREYTDLATGQTFTVLLVHCRDAADMGAHYPPACYPGSGLRVTLASRMPLPMSEFELQGVEYAIEPLEASARSAFRLWNCMILPNGMTTHDPQALRRQTRTGNLRYYGAGQIQVLVSDTVPETTRREIYRRALEIYEPALRTMLSSPSAASTRATQPHTP